MVPAWLRRELELRNVYYEYPNEKVFYCSQWKWQPPVYVAVRVLLAGYSIYSLILHLVDSGHLQKPSIVYFGAWSYFLLTAHLVCTAIISVYFYRKSVPDASSEPGIVNPLADPPLELQATGDDHSSPTPSDQHPKTEADVPRNSDLTLVENIDHINGDSADINITRSSTGSQDVHEREADKTKLEKTHSTYESFASIPSITDATITLKWYFKLSWMLSNLATSSAPVATALFFSSVYPRLKANLPSGLDLQNTNVHILNIIFVIIDHVMCARPIRLLHVLAPIIYGLIYILFTLIYWSTSQSNPVIYSVLLDWANPGAPIGWILGLTFGVFPVIQFTYFGVHQLKAKIHLKLYGCTFDEYNS